MLKHLFQYVGLSLIALTLSFTLYAQTDCSSIYSTVEKDIIFERLDFNSELIFARDTVHFALDPVLENTSNKTYDRRIYEAASYILVFERLTADLSAARQSYFGRYVTASKEYLCSQLTGPGYKPEIIKQTVRDQLMQCVADFAKENGLVLDDKNEIRGLPSINVKFVSSPTGATVQYTEEFQRLVYKNNIPEELWRQADEGEIKTLKLFAIYYLRFRWNTRESWQTMSKQMDKNGDPTVIYINKSKK